MVALMATIACLVAYPGCGPEIPQPPEPLVSVGRFAVSYERSGGLLPSRQRLVVRPGRRAAVTTLASDGTRHRARFRLSVLTVKRLRNALSGPAWDSLESSPPGSCADCFVHAISYDGRSVELAEDEVPLWLRKTVRRFEALVEAHRPFH